MKSTLALVAVAGFAAAASAQTGSLSIVASASTIDSTTTTSFTLSVFGDADFGTAISGGAFSLTAVGGDMVTNMVASSADWGALGFQDNGYGSNGNYNGMIFGQLIFPPFILPDPASLLGAGSVFLGSFDVTIAANSAGTIDWSTAGGVGDFILEIFTDDGGSGVATQLTTVDFGGTSVNVVPAPSALALMGLGGLVAGRRRR